MGQQRSKANISAAFLPTLFFCEKVKEHFLFDCMSCKNKNSEANYYNCRMKCGKHGYNGKSQWNSIKTIKGCG